MLWNKPFLDDGLEISPPWGDISIANLRALTCTRAAKSNHFVDIKWQLRRLFQFTLQCQTLWCRKTYGQIKLPVFLVFLLVIAKGTGSPSRFPYGPTTCGASLAQHVVSICSMVLEYLPTFALVQNHPVNCRFLYTSAMVRIWDVVPCVKKTISMEWAEVWSTTPGLIRNDCIKLLRKPNRTVAFVRTHRNRTNCKKGNPELWFVQSQCFFWLVATVIVSRKADDNDSDAWRRIIRRTRGSKTALYMANLPQNGSTTFSEKKPDLKRMWGGSPPKNEWFPGGPDGLLGASRASWIHECLSFSQWKLPSVGVHPIVRQRLKSSYCSLHCGYIWLYITHDIHICIHTISYTCYISHDINIKCLVLPWVLCSNRPGSPVPASSYLDRI